MPPRGIKAQATTGSKRKARTPSTTAPAAKGRAARGNKNNHIHTHIKKVKTEVKKPSSLELCYRSKPPHATSSTTTATTDQQTKHLLDPKHLLHTIISSPGGAMIASTMTSLAKAATLSYPTTQQLAAMRAQPQQPPALAPENSTHALNPATPLETAFSTATPFGKHTTFDSTATAANQRAPTGMALWNHETKETRNMNTVVAAAHATDELTLASQLAERLTVSGPWFASDAENRRGKATKRRLLTAAQTSATACHLGGIANLPRLPLRAPSHSATTACFPFQLDVGPVTKSNDPAMSEEQRKLSELKRNRRNEAIYRRVASAKGHLDPLEGVLLQARSKGTTAALEQLAFGLNSLAVLPVSTYRHTTEKVSSIQSTTASLFAALATE